MEINPKLSNKISSNGIQNNSLATEENLNQLNCEISVYFDRFNELFSNAKDIQIQDFVSLELLGHELEIKAKKAQESISALAKVDLNKAQDFKNQYDANLSTLHANMKALIEKVLPELKAEIDEKFKEFAESQSMNPAAALELNKSIQHFKMIVQKVDQEIKRVQAQRLFQL